MAHLVRPSQYADMAHLDEARDELFRMGELALFLVQQSQKALHEQGGSKDSARARRDKSTKTTGGPQWPSPTPASEFPRTFH